IQTFCYINIKQELLEYNLRDNVNRTTINASQLEFTIKNFFNSFSSIFESCNMQLEEINDNKILIKEIVDISNPAFIRNNNLFIKNQGK
ncbi:2162_t:CDS:1, partial [Racocetra fulgida]